MKYEEDGNDPKDLEDYPKLDDYPWWFTKEIECNMCKNKGSIADKNFNHVCEGEPIPFVDYVICQNCGYKQLI